MNEIPAFTPMERRIVEAGTIYRYGKPAELVDATVELKLDPASPDLTDCPAFYWLERNVQFVVCKTTEARYRSYFFYGDYEQFRIGEKDYDSLEECVSNLLQLQADHESIRRGILSGNTRSDLEDDYHGPLIV